MFAHSLKLLIFSLCVLLSVPGVCAKSLSADDARGIAAGFFKAGGCGRLADASALTLAQTSRNSVGDALYYVFNASDGRGFIIVSADDKLEPVIGYSYEGSFNGGNLPEAASSVLGGVGRYISALPETQASHRRAASYAAAGSRKELSTAVWSQESPFNNLIPNRRLTGCVGVAMAIIMRHHKYPAQGTGSIGSVDFNVPYNWANMKTDNYRGGYNAVQANAVATLVSHCAQAILTDFGMSSSSAFEVRVPYALTTYFGYDAGVSYKKRAEMDKASWDALIVAEIEAGRPVLYSGQDVSVGHAFVCDGYEMRGSETYFHINWGWGGTANAYFASDALNPSASREYHFNDQTTIVYNIKPAALAGAWSPIHITSDGGQIGMTTDVADLAAGTSFTVRVGALKNISNDNFSGSMAVALYGGDGSFKTLLGNAKGFNLQALQISNYADFSCTVPVGTTVVGGDKVRIVTKANGTENWLPVAGDLLVIGEVPAIGNVIPYFAVEIPPLSGDAIISKPGGDRVIKGRDYSFNVKASGADKVVTVKANGFILTSDANSNYRIGNVNSDQKVSVLVQNAADVVSKRNVWVSSGKLSEAISDADAGTIKDLTLYGTIDVTDFTFIRERMKVQRLDLSGVRITANGNNPANAIPSKAFYWYGSLKEIVLPSSLTTLKNGCFTGTGLSAVEIPASVGTWEYNVFLGCSELREVTVRRQSPAWINWCVFNGSPRTKLIVPVGSEAAYRAKENWADFKEIVGQNPVPASSYTVDIQEIPGVKITAENTESEVAPGTTYKFTVETDDSFGDATMEVYANSTRLYADAAGVYTTVINAKTLLHTNFKQPEAVSESASVWKITGANGGAGLVTDVINVVPGKTFSLRVNALAISADRAAMFYGVVLTDSKGAIKEFISPVVSNRSDNYGNLPCTFTCQVKDASVREGNLIRIVTSHNKKNWYLVDADSEGVCDRIKAVGNEVQYHSVTMPSSIEGATISGAVTQVVHGMPFNITVVPVSEDDRVTISVNDVIQVADAATGKLSIGSVMEDLNVAIQVNPKGTPVYNVLHVQAGELEAKMAALKQFSRIKLVGTVDYKEFSAIQAKIAAIEALDLADLTIMKNGQPATELPSLGPISVTVRSMLKTVILPMNIKIIGDGAFSRSYNMQEITIPASVTEIKNNAFSTCIKLTKITMLSPTPCVLGNMGSSFQAGSLPPNEATIYVPKGSLEAYNQAAVRQSEWQRHKFEESAIYFNVQVDQKRVVNVDPQNVHLSKIPYPDAVATVALGLPNSKEALNPSQQLYPGKAFRLYDNGVDVTTTAAELKNGIYNVTFDPAQTDKASLSYPANHVVEAVIYHSISFNKSSDKVAVKMEGTDETTEWKDVPMSLFDEASSEVRPALYKERGSYGFTVSSDVPNMEPKVKITNHAGEVQTVIPGEDGVYAIADLQGDVTVDITMVPSEGAVLSAEEIVAVDTEGAADVTSIGVSGEVPADAFGAIRDNFSNLETLNLADMENTAIPEEAFAGMENLSSVVIPDNVTEIGDGAFRGCGNLESLTLTSVETIGAGAFDGCSNLTSITITGGAASGEARAKSRAARAAGITDASFEGLNPNCIIFVSDPSIVLTGKNNVVYNGNGIRQAMTDITLSSDYAFNTPGSFNLGDKTISLSVPVGYKTQMVNDNWTGIVLPFVPSMMTMDGVELSFAKEGDNTMSLRSFADDVAEELTDALVMEPNMPYVVRLNAEGTANAQVVFSATGKSEAAVADDELTTEDFDVQTTPVAESIVCRGKDFSMFADYAGRAYVQGDYALNENGSEFRLVDPAEPGVAAPFSVYMRANSESAPESFVVSKEEGTSAVGIAGSIGNDRLTIFRDGSSMVIVANAECDIEVFDLRGIRVASLRLAEGRNTVELPAGIYIVDGLKVIM